MTHRSTRAMSNVKLGTRLELGSRPITQAPVQLRAIAPTLEISESDAGAGKRTITGTITVYDSPSTSQGIVIHEGSLTARQPLTRLKLLRDHDHSDPVGYATDLSADGLTASFYVPEGESGDRALSEAENHLRDGLSIGFSVKQYAFDDDWNLHVYEAELYEVSLCAIPDMADAGVTDVAAAATPTTKGTLMNREQLAAALAAGTITQGIYDREIARLDQQALSANGGGNVTPLVQPGVDPALAAGPTQLPGSAPIIPATTTPRGLSLHAAIDRVTSAFRSGDRTEIALAIQDVVPADDAGQGFLGREDWFGEVWRASDFTRVWIDAIGPVQPLNNLKWKGYYWDVRPKPTKYAGNKGEVGSNKPSTKPIDGEAGRWAGGWDIDRAFIDFGDSDYLAAFWAAAVQQYQLDSDEDIATQMIAAATAQAPLPAGTSAMAMVKAALRPKNFPRGAKINRVFMADDLYDEFLDTDSENLPLWLAKAQLGLSPAEGTAEVDQLFIRSDSGLEDGTIISFDNRTATVREKQIPQLKAFDVAHAGVDLGFYSYGGLQITDERLVIEQSRAAA